MADLTDTSVSTDLKEEGMADPQNCPDASLGKKKKKPKLKRVLMSRSKADLNSSKGMCFVRNKGKNLSFNSSVMRQTLRSNNRALAKALENVKYELKATSSANLDLQQQTQSLQMKCATLSHVAGIKNEDIEKEVQVRMKKRMFEVKGLLNQVSSNLLETVNLLGNALAMCSDPRATSLGALSRDSSLGGRTSEEESPVTLQDISNQPRRSIYALKPKDAAASLPRRRSNHSAPANRQTVENVAQELESTASALSQIAGPIQDMSIIVEQSFLGEDMPLPFTEEPEGLDTVREEQRHKRSRSVRRSAMVDWRSLPAFQATETPDVIDQSVVADSPDTTLPVDQPIENEDIPSSPCELGDAGCLLPDPQSSEDEIGEKEEEALLVKEVEKYTVEEVPEKPTRRSTRTKERNQQKLRRGTYEVGQTETAEGVESDVDDGQIRRRTRSKARSAQQGTRRGTFCVTTKSRPEEESAKEDKEPEPAAEVPSKPAKKPVCHSPVLPSEPPSKQAGKPVCHSPDLSSEFPSKPAKGPVFHSPPSKQAKKPVCHSPVLSTEGPSKPAWKPVCHSPVPSSQVLSKQAKNSLYQAPTPPLQGPKSFVTHKPNSVKMNIFLAPPVRPSSRGSRPTSPMEDETVRLDVDMDFTEVIPSNIMTFITDAAQEPTFLKDTSEDQSVVDTTAPPVVGGAELANPEPTKESVGKRSMLEDLKAKVDRVLSGSDEEKAKQDAEVEIEPHTQEKDMQEEEEGESNVNVKTAAERNGGKDRGEIAKDSSDEAQDFPTESVQKATKKGKDANKESNKKKKLPALDSSDEAPDSPKASERKIVRKGKDESKMKRTLLSEDWSDEALENPKEQKAERKNKGKEKTAEVRKGKDERKESKLKKRAPTKVKSNPAGSSSEEERKEVPSQGESTDSEKIGQKPANKFKLKLQRPGKIIFSAGRRDGTQPAKEKPNYVPLRPRSKQTKSRSKARSKQKQVVELPSSDPPSIFDFMGTPRGENPDKKDNPPKSAYDMSLNETYVEVLPTLGQFRERAASGSDPEEAMKKTMVRSKPRSKIPQPVENHHIELEESDENDYGIPAPPANGILRPPGTRTKQRLKVSVQDPKSAVKAPPASTSDHTVKQAVTIDTPPAEAGTGNTSDSPAAVADNSEPEKIEETPVAVTRRLSRPTRRCSDLHDLFADDSFDKLDAPGIKGPAAKLTMETADVDSVNSLDVEASDAMEDTPTAPQPAVLPPRSDDHTKETADDQPKKKLSRKRQTLEIKQTKKQKVVEREPNERRAVENPRDKAPRKSKGTKHSEEAAQDDEGDAVVSARDQPPTKKSRKSKVREEEDVQAVEEAGDAEYLAPTSVPEEDRPNSPKPSRASAGGEEREAPGKRAVEKSRSKTSRKSKAKEPEKIVSTDLNDSLDFEIPQVKGKSSRKSKAKEPEEIVSLDDTLDYEIPQVKVKASTKSKDTKHSAEPEQEEEEADANVAGTKKSRKSRTSKVQEKVSAQAADEDDDTEIEKVTKPKSRKSNKGPQGKVVEDLEGGSEGKEKDGGSSQDQAVEKEEAIFKKPVKRAPSTIASSESRNSLEVPAAGKRSRRTTNPVSYKEPSVGKKLRRGDPGTNSEGLKEKDLYKAKDGKPKKPDKVRKRSALSLITNIKDEGDSSS